MYTAIWSENLKGRDRSDDLDVDGRTILEWILEKESEKSSFEVFTAVTFQGEVFWVVTPCSVVVVHQRFRGPCSLHLQGDVAL
jgi:hypothetical protein